MGIFLCFRLYGPLVAWGDVAVGERRPVLSSPSKSGVLGLVAAALRIKRDDPDALAALGSQYGFASRVDLPGNLMMDFHTAQVASGSAVRKARKGGLVIVSRREELSIPPHELSTSLTQRFYWSDAAAVACLWSLGPEARWKLEQLQAALRRPGFVLFLGRKSCPLALPTSPILVTANNPVAALETVRFDIDSFLAPLLSQAPKVKPRFYWEGDWADLVPQETVHRRDRVQSRARWQFADRVEHVSTGSRGAHVPEQG